MGSGQVFAIWPILSMGVLAMDFETEWLGSLLQPGFSQDLFCFAPSSFFYFLERDLIQSERYGNYAAFLLCRVGPGQNGQEQQTKEVVRCLSRNIRATDALGMVDDRTVGVVLQNATVPNTCKVAERLKEEVSLHLRAFDNSADWILSFAVYPTEANTFEALRSLAESRLDQPVQ